MSWNITIFTENCNQAVAEKKKKKLSNDGTVFRDTVILTRFCASFSM